MEALIDNLTDEQITASLDSAFAQKGLWKVDGDGSADLFIGHQTTELIDEQFAGFGPGWSTGPGCSSGGWYGPTGGKPSTIYKGDLAADMHVSVPH